MWILVTFKCVLGLFATEWPHTMDLGFQDGSVIASAHFLSLQMTEPTSTSQDKWSERHILWPPQGGFTYLHVGFLLPENA